ncbi:MAG: ABC-2 type transport system permease protein [Planctomycetota bacterium]|jgi:ABC-2 type transport system permease protein
MKIFLTLLKRELAGYFATPIAYVFLCIFLILSGVLTFQFGGFLERAATLDSFFIFHPFLYLFLIPALSMRLWAEERQSGTIELLMTLPVTMTQAVLAKFGAAWAFIGIALLLTFPVWWTVNSLGSPDNGVILAGYLGSFLMAGAFLAVGAFTSALTKNQVIAFVLSLALCSVLLIIGMPFALELLGPLMPSFLLETINSFSIYEQFINLSRGLLELRAIVFFISMIALFLFANGVVLDHRKAS